MKRLAILAGAALAELIGHGAQHGTLADFERRQAATRQPTRGEKKRLTGGAANDLLVIASQTIVLNHIHPRWLRKAAEAAMDAGVDVDSDWLDQRRLGGRP